MTPFFLLLCIREGSSLFRINDSESNKIHLRYKLHLSIKVSSLDKPTIVGGISRRSVFHSVCRFVTYDVGRSTSTTLDRRLNHKGHLRRIFVFKGRTNIHWSNTKVLRNLVPKNPQ